MAESKTSRREGKLIFSGPSSEDASIMSDFCFVFEIMVTCWTRLGFMWESSEDPEPF